MRALWGLGAGGQQGRPAAAGQGPSHAGGCWGQGDTNCTACTPPHPTAATLVAFSRPICSVLLWRRSDNIVFALLLGGADLVGVGDGVECKVKGILQVLRY